jgi:AraC family transcriptional regulator, regulatory protein of adaptative response / methylated-DNA-[protein]-cysteine methyltransferase
MGGISMGYATVADRWEAVAQRDLGAREAFVYGVTTTGIYCRPGCPSRLPNRENVRFFDTWETAEAAGFRACKRCAPQSPDLPDAALPAVLQACRIIEASGHAPSLRELADAVGYSPYHFQRLFKDVVGVSPKQYAAEQRLRRVRVSVQERGTITEAAYEAGFESLSRFYASGAPALGMSPSDYRKGGRGMVIAYAVAACYLGWVLVAATSQGVCRVDLDDSGEALIAQLRADFPEAELQAGGPAFDAVVKEILALLEAPDRGTSLPLDIQGTAFQRRVWAALQQIPPGETVSYGELASRIGNPQAARAVAQACAANRVAVAIPCHRVVRGNGALGGYRWGLERKQALLARESAQPDL